ncbi:hypothetical protein F8M41_002930 [Gigaspora margarita]|uniref:Uncharacterized protein n=1 Tax=Gigaspora margarita TaxID=4874 RepID=A0A8H4A7W5_GIGMA|nr:hypothetical protein F8M41_002930 [Gigaspora margarita]
MKSTLTIQTTTYQQQKLPTPAKSTTSNKTYYQQRNPLSMATIFLKRRGEMRPIEEGINNFRFYRNT